MKRALPAGVASPCNSVCRIDEANGLCLGCLRTLDEIAAWSAMDDAHKRALCAALRERRRQARHQAPPAETPR